MRSSYRFTPAGIIKTGSVYDFTSGILKANPYHDEQGRFASGGAAGAVNRSRWARHLGHVAGGALAGAAIGAATTRTHMGTLAGAALGSKIGSMAFLLRNPRSGSIYDFTPTILKDWNDYDAQRVTGGSRPAAARSGAFRRTARGGLQGLAGGALAGALRGGVAGYRQSRTGLGAAAGAALGAFRYAPVGAFTGLGQGYLFGKRDVSQKKRKTLAAQGKALPGGGYPIENRGDLHNAIQAFGRAKNPGATKALIRRRAAALGATSMLPDSWVGKIALFSDTEIMKSLKAPLSMDKGIVWGWASVIEKDGVAVVDKQNDVIPEPVLSAAAHDFVMNSRKGGALHIYKSEDEPLECGEVVESMVFTHELQKALGVDLGKVGWLIGYKITDPIVRAEVEKGGLLEFSIGGKGIRQELG